MAENTGSQTRERTSTQIDRENRRSEEGHKAQPGQQGSEQARPRDGKRDIRRDFFKGCC